MSKAVSSIAVIVASAGRPDNIAVLLERLASQTRLPVQVILSVPTLEDRPAEASHPFPVETVLGSRGLCAQRNRGLERLGAEIDLVVFYDDDFIPSKFALQGMADFFDLHGEIVGATGEVLADGIGNAGFTPAQALDIVEAADAAGAAPQLKIVRQLSGLYGCNMAYRASAIGALRFDERLPLYGWLEDLDFAARTGGPLAKTEAFSGVHCGEKRGREKSGRKLGYAQVCNPVYLIRKGSVSLREGGLMMVRNFLANHAKTLRPEPWVDRKGRAAGNWLAIWDVVRGRVDPERMLDM